MHQFRSLTRSSVVDCDCCTLLVYGIPTKYINKLQRVQNSLARMVTRSTRFTRSNPLLNDLHWLPVRSRIRFKIGLIVYKAINLKQPPSLSKHLTLRTIPNNLRSTNTTILNYGRFAKSFGTQAFSTYTPMLWNSLPATVRQATSVTSFRKLLKAHYFRRPP